MPSTIMMIQSAFNMYDENSTHFWTCFCPDTQRDLHRWGSWQLFRDWPQEGWTPGTTWRTSDSSLSEICLYDCLPKLQIKSKVNGSQLNMRTNVFMNKSWLSDNFHTKIYSTFTKKKKGEKKSRINWNHTNLKITYSLWPYNPAKF